MSIPKFEFKKKVAKADAVIIGEVEQAFRDSKAHNLSLMNDAQDTKYFLVAIFQNTQQVDEALKFCGINRDMQYVDGIEFMQRFAHAIGESLGQEVEFEFDTPTGKIIRLRVNPALEAMAEGVKRDGKN